jgi:UDP-N-acetylglucosamine diphosphorylase/glucosamine-1-phosphate N-acetyltransferase
MNIYIYEDSKHVQFFPLTLLRPVYHLRSGILPLCQKISRQFEHDTVGFVTRDQISSLVAQSYREHPVNIIKKDEGPVLFLNGRIRDIGDMVKLVTEARFSTVFRENETGDAVAVLLLPDNLSSYPPVATQADYLELYQRQKNDIMEFDTTATLYNYNWELMADIKPSIVDDVAVLRTSLPAPSNVKVHDGAFLVNEDDIYIGHDVEILPGAVLDASSGPIYIESNVRIEPHAALVGPCFIGAGTTVLAGKISSSSIGHTCRVGGEVEASIFQSYVNKYHAGFIGHSYVGSWVNFGAMTTNSDLKNNYSDIKLTVSGQALDSGSMKVGSFIGDHTKFGIGTLLNTGITIGVSCNLFGGSLISDREVPSFSWGQTGSYDQYRFDKAEETACIACSRRNVTLSDVETAVLKAVFDGTVSAEGIMDF